MKNIKNLYFALPKQHQIIITSCALVVFFLLVVPLKSSKQVSSNSNGEFKIGQRYQVAIPEQAANDIASSPSIQLPETSLDILESTETPVRDLPSNIEESAAQLQWQSIKVRSGDSLAKIFKRNGLNATTTHKVITAQGEGSKLLKKIQVGDVMRIGKDDKGSLVSLEYPLSKNETLFVNLQNDQYHAYTESKTVEVREAIAQGVIKSNFWNAAAAAGLNDGQIINLANVFGWDIDFALDIRAGDSFNVIYENQYIEGDFIGTGNIVAAEFINQGESFQAIRFTDGEYYSGEGRSMRKAFLRAPVSFKYISSNFKPKRFHPVQKRWKAHRGTDYAAKTGTPVVAAGNGRVTDATYNKYNGNYVFIQHGNGIVTKYLHFSKRAVKKGQRVKQGQVIGYVGSTGLAAGPHLHYEFLLNGVHRNPRTVKLPDAKPITQKYKKAFDLVAKQRLAELTGSRRIMLSMQPSAE
ncbi:peptidoglycan DD-metalloendopeptidase family protein [Colwellia sp. Arc7-635]|uniref:peptidoglycan DD-metalloendopeptidase family protein n=1 Tax=Colwellia sp. Arc7-635 TaxID=2497879 RepID=UPI001F4A0670|nr:peptidoglycan DD-metalloendopeptidase family protein [Colwellia sp. Arc7-635]